MEHFGRGYGLSINFVPKPNIASVHLLHTYTAHNILYYKFYQPH